MASLSSPLRVVLCGRTTAIGKPVAEALLPDYEVIHFIQTNEAVLAELPHLLAGRDPQAANANDVGSHDYSHPARAVIFGRGYELEDIEKFRKAAAGSAADPVAWIVGDPAKKIDMSGPPPGPGYARVAADLARTKLEEWKASGAEKDEVYMY
ncbi:hypothetical protein N7532_008674 [Penicillium argentinense]|uniref:NAD(P)-binding domain-containing protein n=1 Tax=Penicillium argentinense TaxID=1131581 RepID=A0A9W9EY68_9EURO|nr:uncharacterized protein N7532_008674 [Penicillium argentinense]KAJ5089990.1 hypothetical protein N7532_008674 [Penicillium argentinense]